MRIVWIGWGLLVLGMVSPVGAEEDLPSPLREIGYDQRLGEALPLDVRFTDDRGRAVALGDLVSGERPVVLALVYYDCPMICNMVLNGMVSSMRPLRFDAGEEFDVVVVSFDPTEGPELAAAKKANYLEVYDREGAADSWHFLTGTEPEIARLTEAVGFRYRFDEESGEYAHATGLTVLTPTGRIARTLYGIDYPPKDLQFALMEASQERIGSVVDQVLLYCFRYDPSTGRYGAAVINIVRLAGLLTVGAMVVFWIVMWRRGRRSPAQRPAGGVA